MRLTAILKVKSRVQLFIFHHFQNKYMCIFGADEMVHRQHQDAGKAALGGRKGDDDAVRVPGVASVGRGRPGFDDRVVAHVELEGSP